MALRLLPDAEWAATRWLRDHADVPYDVGTVLGSTRPFVQVTRIGGTPRLPYHLDRARIDLDVWASDRDDAVDAARTVHAAIHEAEGQAVTGDLSAVITSVEDVLGLTWVPDPDPSTWHAVVSVLLTLHPRMS